MAPGNVRLLAVLRRARTQRRGGDRQVVDVQEGSEFGPLLNELARASGRRDLRKYRGEDIKYRAFLLGT